MMIPEKKIGKRQDDPDKTAAAGDGPAKQAGADEGAEGGEEPLDLRVAVRASRTDTGTACFFLSGAMG